MTGIDVLVRDVSKLLSDIVNISIQSHDEVSNDKVPEEKIYPQNDKEEPLIDIIDTKSTITIVAIFPDIKENDVGFDVKEDEGILVFEITKFGQVYKKEISCKVRREQLSVKSLTINNSILEMTLEKT